MIRKPGNEHNIFVINLVSRRRHTEKVQFEAGGDVFLLFNMQMEANESPAGKESLQELYIIYMRLSEETLG